MAGEEAEEEEVSVGAETTDRVAGEEGKALDALTDHVEDKPQVSTTSGSEAAARLLAGEQERAKAAAAREKELAAVKLNPTDIDLVAAELELDKKAAERRLRENGGDVDAALRSYVFAVVAAK